MDERGLKASEIGCTWGSFEIITGRILHHLTGIY